MASQLYTGTLIEDLIGVVERIERRLLKADCQTGVASPQNYEAVKLNSAEMPQTYPS